MKSKNLGEEKISKLLFKQALPAMTGMFVMSLYNVVDTIFIGRGVGTLALAGVSVALPFVMSMLAVSLLVPLVLILPGIYGPGGIWASFPISDLLASTISAIFIFKEIKVINKLKLGNV